MSKDKPLEERLLAFCILEGVMLQGPFTCINYFRLKGTMNGLTYLNEKISKDEYLHKLHLVILMKLTPYYKSKGETVQKVT